MAYLLLGNSVSSIISAKAEHLVGKGQFKFEELSIKD